MLETNELTKKLRALLHPKAALIAYFGEDDSYDGSYFIEVRDIDENGLFRKAQYHAIWQDSVQYAVVRSPEGQREICLVQSTAEADDVLQGKP